MLFGVFEKLDNGFLLSFVEAKVAVNFFGPEVGEVFINFRDKGLKCFFGKSGVIGGHI